MKRNDLLKRTLGWMRLATERAFRDKHHAEMFLIGELCLLDWSKRCLPNYFAKPPSKMHHWLTDRLDELSVGRGKKVNLIGPRGGAKSTIGTLAYVLQCAVEGHEPYIWIVSDTKKQAAAHLENIKTELVENRLLAKMYGQVVGVGPRWNAAAIELRNGVVIEAFGTGQRIRGRRKRAYRPTLIVCDDLQNDSHIVSAVRRHSVKEWFHGTLLKAGTKRTNIVNLSTAMHRDDLAMQLEKTAGWQSKRFSSIIRWPTNMSLWEEWEAIYCDTSKPDSTERAKQFYRQHQLAMHQGCELLWPEEEDLYTLMCMRLESGHSTFEREKQSSPIDPELCEWPDSYFESDVWFDDWPRNLSLKTIALDPSKGRDARQGDYSAIILLGVDTEGTIFVEADLQRRPTSQMVADGVEHYQQFRPDAFGIETNQWQQLLAAEFVSEFHRRGLVGVNPCEITNYVNKSMRIRRPWPLPFATPFSIQTQLQWYRAIG